MKGTFHGGLGLRFIEEGRRTQERWEAGKERRINRAKLEPSNFFAYVMGPVVYERGRPSAGKGLITALHAYDLSALEEL